jgi:thiamine-phosphate diphosphorylase
VKPPLPRLHAVTDERVARRADLADVASALAAGGGADLALHARGRALTGLAHYELAIRLTASPPSRLFVNDRLDVALATGATGVQLGWGSLLPEDARRLNPEWWIGKSVHDLAEAEAARTEGADYLLVGPVFATPATPATPTTPTTPTHPKRPPLGPGALGAITRLGLPVVAIGGITPQRVREVKAAGAYGVAAIRALWDAVEPTVAARRMIEELVA